MKVLLWSPYSPWILNFLVYFLLKNNYEVWILNRGNKKEIKKYIEIYKNYGVHFIEFPSVVSKDYDKREENIFRSLYIHFLLIKTVLKSGSFDLINMQYVEPLDLVDVAVLKFLLKTKLILSYWGSDLFRMEEGKLKKTGKFSRCADFVTFDNVDLELKFNKLYKWSNLIPQKTVMLGLPVLDSIKRKSTNNCKEEIRKKWGIDNSKIVIAIGYNGIPEQQHKKVLGVLEKLDDVYKKKIVLLLQMSYGGNQTYRNSVTNAAKKTGFPYIDIQHFLTDDEVAEIRILTDIYINAQATDAFSGSVCEYLFADTVLINARWLRYKEFEKYAFKYLEFDDFNDINGIIEKALKEKVDVGNNKKLIWQLRSWEHCAPKWGKIYRRVCNYAEDRCDFSRGKGNKASSIYHSNTKAAGPYNG